MKNIEVKLTVNFEDQEVTTLSSILGCDEKQLGNELASHGIAALQEMVRMYLGQRVFTRGSDLMEYRLYLLITHAFAGAIPPEQTVCSLFQCTPSGSRSLIRAVMSKYQYQLQDSIETQLKALVSSAQLMKDGDDVVVVVDPSNLVDRLNARIRLIDASLPKVMLHAGTVSEFKIKRSSYERLCTHFGFTPVSRTKKKP